MAETLLVISGVGFAPWAAAGLKQTLTLIDAAKGHLARTVNGRLVDLTPPQFAKYRSTITCDDRDTPLFDGVFPGLEVTVDCVAELAYLTGGAPVRPVVASRTAGAVTFYRPRLDMMVTDWQTATDEWGAIVSWQLDLEEQ